METTRRGFLKGTFGAFVATALTTKISVINRESIENYVSTYQLKTNITLIGTKENSKNILEQFYSVHNKGAFYKATFDKLFLGGRIESIDAYVHQPVDRFVSREMLKFRPIEIDEAELTFSVIWDLDLDTQLSKEMEALFYSEYTSSCLVDNGNGYTLTKHLLFDGDKLFFGSDAENALFVKQCEVIYDI